MKLQNSIHIYIGRSKHNVGFEKKYKRVLVNEKKVAHQA